MATRTHSSRREANVGLHLSHHEYHLQRQIEQKLRLGNRREHRLLVAVGLTPALEFAVAAIAGSKVRHVAHCQ